MTSAAQLAMFTDAEEDILRRVGVALLSPDLTKTEKMVLDCLIRENAFGLHKVVSIAKIQGWASAVPPHRIPTDRTIKDAVKRLLEVYDVPIGSSRIPGRNGYAFICTDKDAEDASRPLRNEIYSMFRRLKVISPKSSFVRQLQGQFELLKPEAE